VGVLGQGRLVKNNKKLVCARSNGGTRVRCGFGENHSLVGGVIGGGWWGGGGRGGREREHVREEGETSRINQRKEAKFETFSEGVREKSS